VACPHGLRHDFARPVWLCDVALLMERLPEDADREHLLAGPPPLAWWVQLALSLAAGVLGASAERVPRGEAPPPAPAGTTSGWHWRTSPADRLPAEPAGGALARRDVPDEHDPVVLGQVGRVQWEVAVIRGHAGGGPRVAEGGGQPGASTTQRSSGSAYRSPSTVSGGGVSTPWCRIVPRAVARNAYPSPRWALTIAPALHHSSGRSPIRIVLSSRWRWPLWA